MSKVDNIEHAKIYKGSALKKCDEKVLIAMADVVDVSSLTIHGLPRVLTSPSGIVKILWLSLFVGSCIGFFMFSIPAFNKYRSYATIKSSVLTFDSSIMFPSITVCNMRKLTIRQYTEFQNEQNVSTKTPNEVLNHVFLNAKITKDVDFNEFSLGYARIVNITPNFCVFGINNTSCNTSWFKSVSLVPGCLTFNSEGTLKQYEVGQRYGFQLLMYINSSEYNVEVSSKDLNFGASPDDIIVKVHEPGSFPNLWSKIVYAEVGRHTQIELSKKTETLLPAPFDSNCDSRSDVLFPGSYIRSTCTVACCLNQTYSKCGDLSETLRLYFSYNDIPMLNVSNASKCAADYLQTFIDGKTNICDCPFPCKSTYYDTSSTTSMWPSDRKIDLITKYYSELLQTPIERSDFRNNFAYISVFYNEFRSIYEEEEANYDAGSFIADLGGQAGLCMGASFFSIFELMIVAVFYLLSRIINFLDRIMNFICHKYTQNNIALVTEFSQKD